MFSHVKLCVITLFVKVFNDYTHTRTYTTDIINMHFTWDNEYTNENLIKEFLIKNSTILHSLFYFWGLDFSFLIGSMGDFN